MRKMTWKHSRTQKNEREYQFFLNLFEIFCKPLLLLPTIQGVNIRHVLGW